MKEADTSFTLVFEGDIRKFDKNPMREETQFGTPYAVGVGDAFSEIDALTEKMEKAIQQIEDGDYNGAIVTLMEPV